MSKYFGKNRQNPLRWVKRSPKGEDSIAFSLVLMLCFNVNVFFAPIVKCDSES